MSTVETNRSEYAAGSFAWLMPLILAVAILTLSWTGLFVVVSDLIQAASSITMTTDAVPE